MYTVNNFINQLIMIFFLAEDNDEAHILAVLVVGVVMAVVVFTVLLAFVLSSIAMDKKKENDWKTNV